MSYHSLPWEEMASDSVRVRIQVDDERKTRSIMKLSLEHGPLEFSYLTFDYRATASLIVQAVNYHDVRAVSHEFCVVFTIRNVGLNGLIRIYIITQGPSYFCS